jgi:sugar transferase (PEP-CTERM/EpsH1 system associated)
MLVLPRPLFPAHTGGRIRILNIFTRLARQAELHVISLADREADAEVIAQMQERFPRYTPVYWKETRKFSPAFYLEYLASRFSRLPYSLWKYAVPEFREAIEALCARERFDVVVCDTLPTGLVMQDSAVRPRVLLQHNVEYIIWKRHWETETRPLHKWLLRAEWEKGYQAEAEVCRASDHVLAVSEEDRNIFCREFGIAKVTPMALGVDADYFSPPATPPEPGSLVFVGSMDWYPNEDGIFWFVRQVYPLIRQSAPHARLTVVGRNPSARLRAVAAADPSVEITGTVEDVRPYLGRAEAVVVPLRIGGGTRIKIFEAMSAGRPVVSTTLGAEGLPVKAGREILLADEPAAFARAVVGLLENPAQREAIGRAAREKVVRDHSWETVVGQVMDVLARVHHGKVRPAMMTSAEPVAAGPASRTR